MKNYCFPGDLHSQLGVQGHHQSSCDLSTWSDRDLNTCWCCDYPLTRSFCDLKPPPPPAPAESLYSQGGNASFIDERMQECEHSWLRSNVALMETSLHLQGLMRRLVNEPSPAAIRLSLCHGGMWSFRHSSSLVQPHSDLTLLLLELLFLHFKSCLHLRWDILQEQNPDSHGNVRGERMGNGDFCQHQPRWDLTVALGTGRRHMSVA